MKKFEAAVDRFIGKLDVLYHKYHILFDVMFYVCFVVFVGIALICDCEKTIRMKVVLKPYTKQFVWIMDHYLLPLLAGAALAFDFKDKKLRLATFFSLYIIFIYQAVADKKIVSIIPHCNLCYFGVACFVVAAIGRDFKKIGWTYVISKSILMLVITALAVTGVIPDLVFEEIGRAGRHALGLHYPLNYAAHWFSIALVYCYLKNGFLKVWDYIGLGALWAVSAFVCKAQTSMILFTVLGAGTLFRQIRYAQGKNRLPFGEKVNAVFRTCLRYSFLIMAAVMIIGSLAYLPQFQVLATRFPFVETFLSRFKCGRIGLLNYFPSALGVDYPTSTWNGTIKSDHYFFIDCSYIYMLLRCGVLIFGIVMTDLGFIPRKVLKQNHVYGLWILALFAVICAMEHHLIDLAFNPFLLMTFAVLPFNRTDGERKPT